MDSSDVTQLIILLILLGLSAFFSSAETALTTVNKIRIRSLAEDGNKRAKTVLKITDDSGKMLSAILIGNNIVNLSAASLTTSLAYSFGGSMVAIASGILTVLILLFGEITPKTMATIHAEKMALIYAPHLHEGHDAGHLYHQRTIHRSAVPSACRSERKERPYD